MEQPFKQCTPRDDLYNYPIYHLLFQILALELLEEKKKALDLYPRSADSDQIHTLLVCVVKM